MGRHTGVLAATMVVALAAACAALGDRETVRLTRADQAAAKAVVLRIADLGGAKRGWTGGAKKPQAPSSLNCGTYNPKQSDLVLTGQAESNYRQAGIEFDNQVELLKTAQMVSLDWQRTVKSSELLPCLRRLFAKNLSHGETFVSFEPISFPKTGTYSAAYRALVDVGTTTKIRVMIDFTLVGVNRTEITLITTAPYVAVHEVAAAEARLAQTLVARAQTGTA